MFHVVFGLLRMGTSAMFQMICSISTTTSVVFAIDKFPFGLHRMMQLPHRPSMDGLGLLNDGLQCFSFPGVSKILPVKYDANHCIN